MKSAAFPKIDYFVVHPADGSLILKEENWPPEARWILTAFLASEEGVQRGYATPRFILAQGGSIAFTATGNAGWRERMWPKIQEVTGTQDA